MSSQDHSSGHHFVAPLSLYFGVFGALLVLTGVTVGVTEFDLGRFNIIVAMIVAVIKATLVVLFFMGLSWDHDRFNSVVFGGALLFLSLFFVLTFPDLLYRDALDPVKGNPGTNPAAWVDGKYEVDSGHVNPDRNPKRLYGAKTATGASSSSSGVLVLESAGSMMPGGDDYQGKSE